jgi:hypothetical protein
LKASLMANTRSTKRRRKDRKQTLREESSKSNKSRTKTIRLWELVLLLLVKVKMPSNRPFNNNTHELSIKLHYLSQLIMLFKAT